MGVYILYYAIITIAFILLINYKFSFRSNIICVSGRSGKWVDKQIKFFMVVAAFLLIVILGCRSDHQGQDLYNTMGTGYFYYYLKINDDTLIEILQNFSAQKYANFEIGFVLYSKLLGTLCGEQQILLFGSALLAIVPAGVFINKCSPNKWLSLILFIALPFFATVMFSAIRQGIAIGMVMLSYVFIRNKQFFRFCVTIAIACTFHSSAIVALVAYPVYHLRFDRKSMLFAGVGSLGIIYFLKEWLFLVLAGAVFHSSEFERNNSINLFLVLTVAFCVCVMLYRKNDYETRGFINIFWLACAAQAFSSLHNLAGRVTWYFMTVLVVLIPRLLMNVNIKEKNIIKPLAWGIGIIAVFLGLFYFNRNSMANAVPYIPFWKT